jgi:large subunit ribosomal protein L10
LDTACGDGSFGETSRRLSVLPLLKARRGVGFAKLAIEGTDKEFLSDHLNGPVALAWSSEDPVAPAKVLSDFIKDNEALEIKAGYLSGKELDLAGIKALADLPSKDELRAKFLSVLNGPAQKFVTITSQVPKNFLLVIKQKSEQGA